jgi:hypothetical protein
MFKYSIHVDKQPSSPGMFSFPAQSAKLLSWSANLHNSQKKQLIDSSSSEGVKLKNGSDGGSSSASRKGHQNNLGLICIV